MSVDENIASVKKLFRVFSLPDRTLTFSIALNFQEDTGVNMVSLISFCSLSKLYYFTDNKVHLPVIGKYNGHEKNITRRT
jgi:hypothetical protein